MNGRREGRKGKMKTAGVWRESVGMKGRLEMEGSLENGGWGRYEVRRGRTGHGLGVGIERREFQLVCGSRFILFNLPTDSL